MNYLKQKVVMKQPRVKADKTGTITAATILELSKEGFDFLNDLSYNTEEVTFLVVPDGSYVDFILKEAKNLTNEQ